MLSRRFSVPGFRFILAAVIAVCIGLGASLTGPGHGQAVTTSTSAAVHDAEVPAPHIAGPFDPSCRQVPFDVNQFQMLSPAAIRPSGPADRSHVLSVCADASVSLRAAAQQ